VSLNKKGVLGLKRIEDGYKPAILKHIWNIFAQAGSLWVSWVENILKGRPFWAIKVASNISWGWKKILKFRALVTDSINPIPFPNCRENSQTNSLGVP